MERAKPAMQAHINEYSRKGHEPMNGEQPRVQMLFGPHPQNAKYYDKPGSYQLAVRITDAEVDPGNTTVMEVYLTGYGFIEGAKILFHPPPHFIDENWSTASLNPNLSPQGVFTYGADSVSLSEDGTILILSGGYKEPQWSSYSQFFDVGRDYNPQQPGSIQQIASERKFEKAPLELSIKTKSNTPSGVHKLNFYLTYFNGQEWKGDSKSVQLKVPNWFERNQFLSLAIAALSLLVAIGPALLSRIKWLLDVIS
jgi:hypothetical protein